MDIIPALDIRGGKCVRLFRGNYQQETVFSDDPLDMALKWQSQGAPRLHIVDLDGAASGEIVNLEVIRNIAKAMLIPVQLGGGIRNLETIEMLLKIGIDRVILGTAAVEDPKLVTEACHRFRDAIIVGIDAREGYAATRGWVKSTEISVKELAVVMKRAGVQRFIYTDIHRDGTLTEPNFSSIAELIDFIRLPVIAAGGVASINHLKILNKLGAEGAIVGKAIYTDDINLKQAIAEINQTIDEPHRKG